MIAGVRLLAFDMDGVLADTSMCHAAAFEDLWDRLGIDGPPYEKIAGRTTRDVVTEQTARLRPSAARITEWVSLKQELARRRLATDAVLFVDTIPCLEALAEHGYQIALATSGSRAAADIVLLSSAAAACFSSVATGDDVQRGKPAPDVYTLTMERTGHVGDETLVVEDSVPGVAAGIAAGAWVASVRSGVGIDHPRFLGRYPDLVHLSSTLGVEVR